MSSDPWSIFDSEQKQVVSQLPFSRSPHLALCVHCFACGFCQCPLIPGRQPKETLLQVKERTAREIRNRTEARVRALLHKDSESEDLSSDEEDLVFIPCSSPSTTTVKPNNALLVYWLASVIVILLLIILLLTQHIYLIRRN